MASLIIFTILSPVILICSFISIMIIGSIISFFLQVLFELITDVIDCIKELVDKK